MSTRIASECDAEYFHDWGGGLIWLSLDQPRDELVRAAVAEAGGHATLIVADADRRRSIPVFEPQGNGLAGLTNRVKDGFDPKRILNPGRIYASV